MRAQKGITLVALIITIIVLLILAMVTIGTLTSEHGIVNNAESAKNEYEDSVEAESANLLVGEGIIANKLEELN